MPDRLTQLQDTVNLVSSTTITIASSANYSLHTFQYIYISFSVDSFRLQQAEHFCNSIGILQQCSVPSKFPGFERIGVQHPNQTTQEDYAQLFSTLISR